MRALKYHFWIFSIILLSSFSANAEKIHTHYSLKAVINPLIHSIGAEAQIQFSEPQSSLRFRLHQDLEVEVLDENIRIEKLSSEDNYHEYVFHSEDEARSEISLRYTGRIFTPVVDDISSGLISADGVALFGSTYWYPHFENSLFTFELKTFMPLDWISVSQGTLLSTETQDEFSIQSYHEDKLQEQIYLMANQFTVYEEIEGDRSYRVFLRNADAELAERYLSLVPQYIEHYENILGPFPYTGFSIVENFWETGYGMPGFTLLGPTVIRLPFILTTSLPHEILHNWWGNSVYVDYARGNWAEGLTTFMSDYWQAQIQNQEQDYRQKALMAFTDFVSSSPEADFPLRSFQGRHNDSSQAIGYSKSMMLYVMLEKKIGKETVQEGLRHFYLTNQFKKVSFEELQAAFEYVSQTDLNDFFKQWLDRKGAPELRLERIRAHQWGESHSLSFQIRQTQEETYDLDIPVEITLESGDIYKTQMNLKSSVQDFLVVLPRRPVRIQVDPHYEVFRKIHFAERSATLSSAMSQKKISYLSATEEGEKVFDIWSQRYDGGTHLYSPITDSMEIPEEGTLVLIGDSENIREFVAKNLEGQNFSITEDKMSLFEEDYTFEEHSSVLVGSFKKDKQRQFIWIRWPKETDIADWARRLTHYSSFGVLVFKDRPVILKTAFPAQGGPLDHTL